MRAQFKHTYHNKHVIVYSRTRTARDRQKAITWETNIYKYTHAHKRIAHRSSPEYNGRINSHQIT